MQAQDGGGCIINIASTNGIAPVAGRGRLRRREGRAASASPRAWRPSGRRKVRVNAVTAGIIGTDEIFDIHYGNDPERLARLLGQVPMGRFSSPGGRGRGVPLPGVAARGAGDRGQPLGARRR